MAEVLYVKPSREKGRLTVGLETEGERHTYSVSESVYHLVGEPQSGEELDDDGFEILYADDEKFRAMKKALSLLSYADNNKRTLYLKLVRAGFSRGAVSFAVGECVRLGYIDERRQLTRIICREANGALRGRRVIRQRLVSKGYSPEDIDDILDDLLRTGEIDFSSNFERLCEKRGAKTDEERGALMYKFGYREGDV